jgi:hypothetical protein
LYGFFNAFHQEIENLSRWRVPKFIELAGKLVSGATEATGRQMQVG